MNTKSNELESSLHLFQRPSYKCEGGSWQKCFDDSINEYHGRLTWDTAAILSINSFGYVLGDRTLVKEIKRRPWLSRINKDGSLTLEKVPMHGRLWDTQDNIAARFEELLCQEALEVCTGCDKLYILLSGGLDSRIVAGIIHKLSKSGQITSDVTCVTWGLEDCRDVEYGKFISKLIGFKWQHIPISWENLLINSTNFAITTEGMTSPVHLHRFDWFCNIEENSIVLSGSYGDSVGRAEYSGNHLLELDYLKPVNMLGLINKDVLSEAVDGIKQDLEKLHRRCEGEHKYVLCECEREGHYMRNMLAHIMSFINNYGTMYQMFTHPDVYSYMWSLHPSLRDDVIYAKILKRLSPELASMPWARTGRALEGKTSPAFNNLRRNFHDYKNWVSGPIYEKLRDYVDPVWFGDTGIFDRYNVKKLSELVESKNELYGFTPYERWAWLVVFRRMAEHIENIGKEVVSEKGSTGGINTLPTQRKYFSLLKRFLSNNSSLYGLTKNISKPLSEIRKRNNRKRLKENAIIEFPPVFMNKQQEDIKC